MLVQHFWLLCGLWCGGVNGWFIWRRLQKYEGQAAFSQAEARRFVQGLSLAVFLPMACFWLLQLSASAAPSPNFLTWSNPHKQVALALQVALWAGMGYWVFAKGGAHTLSTYLGVGYSGKVYTFFFSPNAFRVMTVGSVVSGVVSALATLPSGA